MTDDNMKAKAGQSADALRDAGKKAADGAKAQARGAMDEAKATAQDLAARAREEAERRASEQRDALAEEGGRFAESLRHAAEEQDEGSLQRRLLESVAGGVEDLSDSLRGRSFGDMISGAEDFARRNPTTFLVGAAVAGFAIARFARASAAPRGYGETHDDDAFDDDFESGYGRTATPGTGGYAGTTVGASTTGGPAGTRPSGNGTGGLPS